MKKTINGYRAELLVHNEDALMLPRTYLCRDFEVNGNVVTLGKAKALVRQEWQKHDQVVLVNVPVRIVAASWEVSVKGSEK